MLFLALVGCGGGGGGSTPTSTPVTPAPPASPTPVSTAAPTLPPSGSTIVARPAQAPAISYTDYVAPGGGYGIATTADGTIFVSQGGQSRTLVRIAGTQATPITLPSPYSGPGLMTRGSDGAIWFSNQHIVFPTLTGNVGRVDAAGNVTEFDVGETPLGMTLGPDGNVWFAETFSGRVGRITPTGGVADFSLGAGVHRPTGVATGSDGNIWVAEGAGQSMTRMTPSGTIVAQYAMPVPATWIAPGPDGAMWFGAQNQIGRIDVLGRIWWAQLPCDVPNVANNCLPGYFQDITGMAAGSDAAVWMVAGNFHAVARLTPDGGLYEFPLQGPNGGPIGAFSIAPVPGGFVIVGGANRIARVAVP